MDYPYVDQDAIPTLIEVKRSSDTRIRREVVGQMFDYAANGVARWTVEQLKAGFLSGQNASEDLDRFPESADAGEFWSHIGLTRESENWG